MEGVAVYLKRLVATSCNWSLHPGENQGNWTDLSCQRVKTTTAVQSFCSPVQSSLQSFCSPATGLLNTIGEHICFIWQLPTELLMLITSQLTQESLLALSQVCMLFREIAALQYFALLEFNIPRDYGYLQINDGCCRALLVWRRTDAFVLPNSICFSVSQTTSDHHFYALRIFFESLTSAIRRMHIHLYSGPYKPTVGFLCLLESIHGSGCTQLGCYGIVLPGKGVRIRHSGVTPDCQSSLKGLELASALFFAPLSIDFTLSTIQNASLVRLKLQNTGLAPAQWASLLKILDLGFLHELDVEVSCPAQSLNFCAITG